MAYISEIHYWNTAARDTGIDEYVEVSLTPAEDAAVAAGTYEVIIATYDITGNTDASGNPTGTLAGYANLANHASDPDLTRVFDNSTGYWIYTFTTVTTAPDGGINNAEAIALIETTDVGTPSESTTTQFIDIGGGTTGIVAIDGPANGETSVNIAPSAPANQSIQFDSEGDRVDSDVTSGTTIPCFANGTQIQTDQGFVAIENLKAGDKVQTLDAGLKIVRWVGHGKISACRMIAEPKLRPVLIPGDTDLRVSRQHRLLIKGAIAQRMFGQDEILVPAKDLIGQCGVIEDPKCADVTYYHILLDDHHILNANGVAAESLYLGKEAIKAMSPEARAEIEAILPEICETPTVWYRPACAARNKKGGGFKTSQTDMRKTGANWSQLSNAPNAWNLMRIRSPAGGTASYLRAPDLAQVFAKLRDPAAGFGQNIL